MHGETLKNETGYTITDTAYISNYITQNLEVNLKSLLASLKSFNGFETLSSFG